jgi:hypothetical protein
MNIKIKIYFFAILFALSNFGFITHASAQAWTCRGNSVGLGPNGYLDRGQAINYGDMTIAHQNDGNVVAYHNGRAVWATNTAGRATTRLIMQTDGNLVLYGPSGAVWASYTFGTKYRYFLMYSKCGSTPGMVGIGNFLGPNQLFFSFRVLAEFYY